MIEIRMFFFSMVIFISAISKIRAQDSLQLKTSGIIFSDKLITEMDIWQKPTSKATMDSLIFNGTEYKLTYETGSVNLVFNKKGITTKKLVENFFVLSIANGGDIYGKGAMKIIKGDLYFSVNAGQFGKVMGVFKYNIKTDQISKIHFIDHYSKYEDFGKKNKYKLKTRQINTYNFTDLGLLEQYRYELELNLKAKDNPKSIWKYDAKRYRADQKKYEFLKSHLEKPYYFQEEDEKDPSYLHDNILESKNIFSDDGSKYSPESFDLQNAAQDLNLLLNTYKKQKIQFKTKIIDHFLIERTGFSGIYFFYEEENSGEELQVIRYDNFENAWLLSKYVWLDVTE